MKCCTCLYERAEVVRDAVTVFGGYAVCDLHLPPLIAAAEQEQRRMADLQREPSGPGGF